jgi:hypothetical protein
MDQAKYIDAQAQGSARKDCRDNRAGVRRSCAVVAALAAILSITACGGGGEGGVVVRAVPFDIGVVVGGQPISGVTIVSGVPQDISIWAGQSIELDASEPVDWTLQVGGSAVTGSGITVYYGGVGITQTAISPSKIIVDTAAAYPLSVPAAITFIATSTLDSTLVATVNVLITN